MHFNKEKVTDFLRDRIKLHHQMAGELAIQNTWCCDDREIKTNSKEIENISEIIDELEIAIDFVGVDD